MIAISAYTASVMTTTIADVMVIHGPRPSSPRRSAGSSTTPRVSPRMVVCLAARARRRRGDLRQRARLREARRAGVERLMTLAFAGMVVLQRRQPKASMIAVNAIDALGSGLFGLINSPHPPLGVYDLAVLFVFGLTTIGLSFVLFIEGAKLIPSAEAGLISLLDVVLDPGAATLIGGAIVLGAALAHGAGPQARTGVVTRRDRWRTNVSRW